ncbi:MAG: ABC transporter [Cellulomonas sp. 73-145]|uniref:DUF302 domain-containing protein n=1 Tax=Cellulomonas sp. 73-145 TaxID=1895739 RepID=UPI00092AD7FB|nr:DUF302 domain-containing protein [Cellulomonas sp. 73-145]MBN9326869.1 DUF302 domain-containing protein [Cellulomonas sp.]OJV57007.1 MAG: ABC transporter [Cellulomonas sp. 73-145]
MSFALSTTVDLDFDRTVAALREALSTQGFGILTEVDLSGTLKTKLDVDVPRQLLLGACNPAYAYRALQAEERVGLLLPCSLTVRAGADGRTLVDAMDPALMVELTGTSALTEVAAEVRSALRAALDALETR